MTMKQLAILLSAALATPSASTIGMAAFEYHPPEGFVPDAGDHFENQRGHLGSDVR